MAESKRSMGLLRLGRSRWDQGESSKRSMGLLRLGRGGPETSIGDEDEKRSMQLLRLGRKRNDDDVDDYLEAVPDSEADQMPPRYVTRTSETYSSPPAHLTWLLGSVVVSALDL